LLDAKISARENGTHLDEKERTKRERMATMMAGFDLHGEMFSDNERSIRNVIESIDSLQESETISPESLRDLRRNLLETQGIVRQSELTLTQKSEQEEAAMLKREALEKRLASVQIEYEALLEGKLNTQDVEKVKARLADAYGSRQSGETEHVAELTEDMNRKTEENNKMKQEIEVLQQRIRSGAAAVNGIATNGSTNGKTIQQQIAEFDAMKKSLMRDLQNRCERVSISYPLQHSNY
jgi:kinesin family protein 5